MLSAAYSPAILVIDDEDAVLTVIRKALENIGYHVVTARSGGEALNLLASPDGMLADRKVAVAIIDYGVSGDSGSQIAIQIRSKVPGVRILITSGRPLETLLLPSGARFLAKPFTLKALREAGLGEVLEYEAWRDAQSRAARVSG